MRYFILIVLSLSLGGIARGQYITDSLNTEYDEQYPVLTAGGQVMYFTRANHPDNTGGTKDQGDIWYSTLDQNVWQKAVRADQTINNGSYNAVLGIFNGGNSMLLHHHYTDDRQGISRTEKTSSGWSKPVSLNIPYFMNRSHIQSGNIANDGSLVILSMESYGTKGVEDIYVMFLNKDGSWSDPRNIGGVVNTQFQEISPYLAEDNKTLFFASNGHGDNFGSFDIYKSVRLDDSWLNWSTPVNIGNSINTEGKESSYTYIQSHGVAMYVTTQDSDGYGDIRFTQKEEILEENIAFSSVEDPSQDSTSIIHNSSESPVFSGMIKNAKTGTLIQANISLSDTNGYLIDSKYVPQGIFDFAVATGEYHLRIESVGFISKLIPIAIDSITSNYEIILSPIVVGETVNLKSLLFRQGTDQLLPSSNEELNIVVNMMKKNPDMEILLGGHTDNRGSSKLNLKLSEKRVAAVKKYLQSQGISARRVKGKGYGGTRPIASNKNEETRKLNRRVEFTVTKN